MLIKTVEETGGIMREIREHEDQVLNTFLVLYSNKTLVIKAGIHKSLVRIVKREDPDQTASSYAV